MAAFAFRKDLSIDKTAGDVYTKVESHDMQFNSQRRRGSSIDSVEPINLLSRPVFRSVRKSDYEPRDYTTTTYENLMSYRATGHWSTKFRLMLSWTGSIWQTVWKEVAGFLAIYYAIYITIYVICTEEHREQFFKVSEMAVWVKSSASMIPLSFLLGFFHDAMHNRWRAMWDTIWWPDALCMMVNSAIPGDTPDMIKKRFDICRWSFLTSIIAMSDCTYDCNMKYRDFEVMKKKGWITQAEVDEFESIKASMPHGSSWWIPCQWALNLLSECSQQGEIPNMMMWQECCDHILKMRTQCGTMWDIYITGVPVLYMQTVVFATYTYILLILIGQSQFPPDQEYGQVNYYFPIWSVIEIILYLGWLNLSLNLVDPFGRQILDDISWDLDWIVHRNWEVLQTMGKNSGQYPKSKRQPPYQ